jgi:hypothetical protein
MVSEWWRWAGGNCVVHLMLKKKDFFVSCLLLILISTTPLILTFASPLPTFCFSCWEGVRLVLTQNRHNDPI